MAYQDILLKLEPKDIVLVKPSKPTPSPTLSLSTLDNKDFNNNLCQTVHVYQSSTTNDSPRLFKQALSHALVYYYPYAGRIMKHVNDEKFRVVFSANSEEFGVPFLEANASCTLSSLNYLDNTDTEFAKDLVFDPQDKSFPLVFMVTKFRCGGFTIGMGVSHVICDGFGASQLFKAIIELANGKSEPSLKPVWEREILVGPIVTKQKASQCFMNKEPTSFSPLLLKPNTVVKQYCFKIEKKVIEKLKMRLINESQERFESVTTFESLGAYVWRARARALKLDNKGKTVLTMLVSMRRNMEDICLPEGYYGNSTVDAKVVLKASELKEKPLHEIVKLMKKMKNDAFTTDFVKNAIKTSLERNEEEEDYSIGLASGEVMVLTMWKHLGFQESINFGGNEGVDMVIAPRNLFASADTCIFTSPNKLDDHDQAMKGGVRIFISLPVDAFEEFKKEIEALRFLN
ncbi:spermidine coumaroyl-CoA acyltransferase-like [Vicia villosa]|uniref:spermidine coumaroyl-CoA acyltransferase-like n=1 Tax=Vicia villosa TaxID=3911 RepID=UPI00273C4493|nr:spermidine coumaroyl-CoA acyltransferase-like [Vicia villosa]